MANLQDITNRSEVGTIKPWPKATAPDGYVLCDGSAISRTDFADLFAVISTTYGVGNGSTTFNVPNLTGKFPQGKDGSNNLAGTGGANTVTVSLTNNQAVTVTGNIDNTSLTSAQLASHNHNTNLGKSFFALGIDNEQAGVPRQANTDATVNLNFNNAGSGTAHNHSHTLSGTLTGTITGSGTNSFSPFVVVNYIIKH